MTPKEIEDGNIIIGTYHAQEVRNHSTDGMLFNLPGSVAYRTIYELRYHSDWSDIMPVVEKVSRTKIGDGVEYVDYAYPRTFGMLNVDDCSYCDGVGWYEGGPTIQTTCEHCKGTRIDGKIMVRLNGYGLFKADTLIEATWLAVVDYITWLNKQK